MLIMTSENFCKLCAKRIVGKQESHIIPKFLTKTIYFVNGRNQKANTLKFDENLKLELKDKWKQDALKERFLFCKECENYFEILDTHFCNEIYHKIKLNKTNSFIFFKHTYKIASCEKADRYLITLFVISLFLRCHISNLPFCEKFYFSEKEYLTLSQIFNDNYSKTHINLVENFKAKSIENLFSYLILTNDNDTSIDNSENFVESNYRSHVGLYFMVVNEYVFILDIKNKSTFFSEYWNNKGDNAKIVLLSDDQFNQVRTINLSKYVNVKK